MWNGVQLVAVQTSSLRNAKDETRHRGMVLSRDPEGAGRMGNRSTITMGRGVMDQEKYILRLKVLEILRRYHKVQQYFHMMREWKKRWICPN